MKYTFHDYVRKHKLNQIRYKQEQREAIEHLLTFVQKHQGDKQMMRYAIYFVTHSATPVPLVDIARITEYSVSQIKKIRNESAQEFQKATTPSNHGGRKPVIVGSVLRSLVHKIVVEKKTNIAQLTRELDAQYHGVNESSLRRALKRNGLLEHVQDARKEECKDIRMTRFAGVWLLIPFLIILFPKILAVFGNNKGHLRCMLTLFACSLVGIARVFHLPDIQDDGLAVFTGGDRILSRYKVGHFLKKVFKPKVEKFVKMTEPVKEFVGKKLKISIDDHVIARWTRLFRISKAYISTRGRGMKAERLYEFFELTSGKVLRVIAKKGKERMSKVALAITKEFKKRFKSKETRFFFDGAVSAENKTLCGLFKLGDVVVVRAQRRSNIMRVVENIPKSEFTSYKENTDNFQRERIIEVAEITWQIKGMDKPIRMIVAHEERGGSKKGKKEWHLLWTNDWKTDGYEIIKEYRQRQSHEQCYRVQGYDMNLDALPNGYRWWSPSPNRTRFNPKRLQLVGWIKALTFNVIVDWKKQLPKPYNRMMPFTLMRKFLFRTGTVEVTDEEIIVSIYSFRELKQLSEYIAWLNAQQFKIPWVGNRILRIIESATPFRRKSPRYAIWC